MKEVYGLVNTRETKQNNNKNQYFLVIFSFLRCCFIISLSMKARCFHSDKDPLNKTKHWEDAVPRTVILPHCCPKMVDEYP